MRALVIGGTRNLGPSIVSALLKAGYAVSVFNRGFTPDDLPRDVERLHGDRTDPAQLRAHVAGKEFDLVVDTTLYTRPEAHAVVDVFGGRIGQYIFLSTGQVYLVRVGVQRPFKEDDYSGVVMPEPPKANASEYENWLYGHDKRQAEDVFARAWAAQRFPYTSLRLPMVNSERDHYNRIFGYWLRLHDGGPLLIPADSGLPLRHVYGDDVVQAVLRVAQIEPGKAQAYNIGQDETVTLLEFLNLLAELTQKSLDLARVSRSRLDAAGLLPHCSPFSDPWMSALDNTRSKAELGMRYTPLPVYLNKLVHQFESTPVRPIEGYTQRPQEIEIASQSAASGR